MERKEFIKTCGLACLGGTFLSAVFEGCSSSKMVSGTLDQSGMLVPVSAFRQDDSSYRKYIIAQHPKLKYPICIYRFSETQYTALLMRCTHQGAELQVFGDRLECPAHGSQFSNTGVVKNGPADTNLRTFQVALKQDQLHINLT